MNNPGKSAQPPHRERCSEAAEVPEVSREHTAHRSRANCATMCAATPKPPMSIRRASSHIFGERYPISARTQPRSHPGIRVGRRDRKAESLIGHCELSRAAVESIAREPGRKARMQSFPFMCAVWHEDCDSVDPSESRQILNGSPIVASVSPRCPGMLAGIALHLCVSHFRRGSP